MADFETVRNSIDLRDYCDAHGMEQRGRDNYVCPACGSGTGKNHTAAFTVYPDNRWHCYACDRGGDVFDLEGILKDTEDKLEQLEGVMEWAGLPDHDRTMAPAPKRYQPQPDYTEGREREAAYLQAMAGNIHDPEAVNYIEGRGFTVAEAEYFGIGYDPSRHRLVLPWMGCDYYHIDRDVRMVEGKGKYLKPDGDKVGRQPLYNPDALDSPAFFIVEGVLDALAVTVCGFDAIALGGTAKRSFVDLVAKRGTRGVAIIMLDNDDKGIPAAGELLGMLTRAGIAATTATTKTKDAGEWLQADREELGAFLTQQHDNARYLLEAIRKSPSEAAYSPADVRDGDLPTITDNYRPADAVAALDAFIADIQTERYQPLQTGMPSFDKLLGGGIMRQSLVVLSAAPGTGKTALASQIFEQFAANGNPVLFLNLEMSEGYLLARSLSRMLCQSGYKMTATDVLRGYRWSDEQRAHVLEAAYDYRKRIAPWLTYNPHGNTSDIESIRNTLNTCAIRAINEGKPAPTVCLDYLHLLTANRMDAQEIVKAGIAMLKDYAIRFNTFSFAIAANNRDSNKKGIVSQSSARDSSAIEYTADIQLSLNFKELDEGATKQGSADKYNPDSPQDMDLLICKPERDMVVRVLKNRMAQPGGRLHMKFDAAHSLFTPVVDSETEERYKADEGQYQADFWNDDEVIRV